MFPSRVVANLDLNLAVRRYSTGILNPLIGGIKQEEASLGLPFKSIPGPRPLPIIGNRFRGLPLIGKFSIRRLDLSFLSMYEEFGPIVRVPGLLSRGDLVVIYDANDIETLMRSQDHLPDRPLQSVIGYYKKVARKDFFGENLGIIGVDAHNWKKNRLKVQKDMLRPSTSQLYVGSIENITEKFIQRIEEIKDNKSEVPKNFDSYITKWALECMGTVALDTKFGALDPNASHRAKDMVKAMHTILKYMVLLDLMVPFRLAFLTPMWHQLFRALDKFQTIIEECINKAVEKGVAGKPQREWSLLDRLLQTNSDDPKAAAVMAIDMFLVGIDSTSAAALSTLYMLTKHQDVQEKIYKEVSSVLSSHDSEITFEKLEKMKYLKCTIKEILRLYPPAIANSRVVTDDIILRGYHIPKGTPVICALTVSSKSEKHYDRPEEFIPDRWLKDSGCPHSRLNSNLNQGFHPFSNIPFGFGSRMCIGKRFADMMLQMVICKVIHKYKIDYDYGDLDIVTMPVYTFSGPLKFKFTPRL